MNEDELRILKKGIKFSTRYYKELTLIKVSRKYVIAIDSFGYYKIITIPYILDKIKVNS